MTPTNRRSVPGADAASTRPLRWRKALPFAAAALVVAGLLFPARPAGAQAALAGVAGGDAEASQGSPWAGSSVWYTHQGTATSLYKPADLTWNPYYAHQVMVRPSYRLNKLFFFTGQLTLTHELTMPDDGQRFVLSDTILEGFWSGWQEPNSKIRFGASFRTVLPTSIQSRNMSSLILAVAPTVRASRGFEVLGGLNVTYFGRATKFFNRYSTMTNQGTGIVGLDCTTFDITACVTLAQVPVANTNFSFMNGLSVSLSLNDKLSLSFLGALNAGFPYSFSASELPIGNGSVTIGPGNEWFIRHATLVSLSGYYAINPIFGVNAGFFAFANQIAPNGTLQNPVFNRSATFSVDLSVDVERLAAYAAGTK